MQTRPPQLEQLRGRVRELELRLEEAEEAVRSIREGEVDALIVSGPYGEQVFSLTGSDAVYRQMVQAMAEAGFTVAADGVILFCNVQFGQLVGRSIEQVIGKRLHTLVAPDNLAIVDSLLHAALEGTVKQRLVLLNSDGHHVPTLVAASLLERSGDPTVCMVATDLTEMENSTELIAQLRHQQQALASAHEELERRVADRTADLSRTVDTLQAEVVRRERAEQILRKRSEQLRTLASELTLAEQRERRRLADVLHDNLQQLLVGAKFRLSMLGLDVDLSVRQLADEVQDLISQSIDCSRSLTGELCPPILYTGGLSAALSWLVTWMEQKHKLAVDLKTESSAEPQSEELTVLLFQAARELLFNVVKHAQTDSAEVRLSRAGDDIELTVVDQGKGFDAHTVLGQVGRTSGFGLFSIRERLDLLGGRMAVRSAPGRGSRFVLRVPAAAAVPLPEPPEPAAASEHAEPAPVQEGEPPKIRLMLVDDHAMLRQGLALSLRRETDIQIVGEAEDGESAVDLVSQIHPDVVLMDINMPRMDGIQATRLIHARHPDICVIGLSMFDEADVGDRIREAGAAGYVSKSGPAHAVVETIRGCVNRAGEGGQPQTS